MQRSAKMQRRELLSGRRDNDRNDVYFPTLLVPKGGVHYAGTGSGSGFLKLRAMTLCLMASKDCCLRHMRLIWPLMSAAQWISRS